VEQGDRAAVELLLRGGADPARLNSVLKSTAVHLAASHAKPDLLALFIGKNERCKAVIHLAASHAKPDLLALFIGKNDSCKAAGHLAASHAKPDLLALFIGKNESCKAAVHLAACHANRFDSILYFPRQD
jgi:ankyrin repeat protein